MTVKTEQEYIAEQINERLAGGIIENACMDESGEYVGFVISLKGHMIPVWVNRDPEGNGSGWLDIQDES